ncbi:MAG: thiolase family protein [Pirellulaceae bacterium]
MTHAVVVECLRTPVGRSHYKRGVFRNVRADELAAHVMRAVIDRSGIDPHLVEDVIFGVSRQIDEQGLNIARLAWLQAGLPIEAGGLSLNRLCGSGLQTVNQAAHSIVAGGEDVHVVGGVEHMHHVLMDLGEWTNPKFYEATCPDVFNMGITAETVAQKYSISRRQQDEFALRSHRRAAEAQRRGDFASEIVPTPGHDQRGRKILVTEDQCVRADTSMEALSQLQPSFIPVTGTVTAGNASPLNDAAVALLMMSEEKARELGLKPLARVVSTAVAGVEPMLMGVGPVPATEKALRRAGLTMKDIGLFELNEAFAAQSLACIKLLEIPTEIVNIRGGGLALGHPLGASGARLCTTLIHSMRDHGVRYGVAAMCMAVGQGMATVFELCE